MYKILLCLEKKEYRKLVRTAKDYIGDNIKKGYVFNKKGYDAKFYKEKNVNGVDCVIFGWTDYELDKYGMDIYGISFHKDSLKNGYILMEFEDKLMTNFKDRSKIPELAQAMNIDQIITRDDFSIVFDKEKEKSREEEEFE